MEIQRPIICMDTKALKTHQSDVNVICCSTFDLETPDLRVTQYSVLLLNKTVSVLVSSKFFSFKQFKKFVEA